MEEDAHLIIFCEAWNTYAEEAGSTLLQPSEVLVHEIYDKVDV